MTEAEAIRQYANLAQHEAGRRFKQFGLEREDAEQEAMIGLLRALRTYNPARGELTAHLRMGCRRHLAQLHRDNMRVKRGKGHAPLPLDGDLVDLLVAADRNQDAVADLSRVMPFVRALKPQERMALLMAAYGYPNREIAKVIKRPAGQMCAFRARCAKKVREAMTA